MSQLEAPERLKTFHEKVIQAGYDQIDFYKDYAQTKENDSQVDFKDLGSNEHLRASDQKLWAAYYDFQALYPSRKKDFNDAIERRLAWFDII